MYFIYQRGYVRPFMTYCHYDGGERSVLYSVLRALCSVALVTRGYKPSKICVTYVSRRINRRKNGSGQKKKGYKKITPQLFW